MAFLKGAKISIQDGLRAAGESTSRPGSSHCNHCRKQPARLALCPTHAFVHPTPRVCSHTRTRTRTRRVHDRTPRHPSLSHRSLCQSAACCPTLHLAQPLRDGTSGASPTAGSASAASDTSLTSQLKAIAAKDGGETEPEMRRRNHTPNAHTLDDGETEPEMRRRNHTESMGSYDDELVGLQGRDSRRIAGRLWCNSRWLQPSPQASYTFNRALYQLPRPSRTPRAG